MRIGSFQLRARLERKRQDCWIGFYWTTDNVLTAMGSRNANVWICLLPMLPIHIWWWQTQEDE